MISHQLPILIRELEVSVHQKSYTVSEVYNNWDSTVSSWQVRERMTQPLALGILIRYFSTDTVTRESAFIAAAWIVVCSAGVVIIRQPCMLAMFHLGLKIRVAVCSLIYRKSLKLSKIALGETTVGQAVNLISNDISRFDVCVLEFMYLWIGPLETICVTYFMYQAVVYFGKRFSTLRLRTALRTDERVRFMNEIICGIQVIKMYAWEKPFANLISKARKYEIKSVQGSVFVYGSMLASEMFGSRLALFLSILSYIMLGHIVAADKVFVIAAYCNILKILLGDFLPVAIGQIAEAHVSVIRKFLLYDEIVTNEADGYFEKKQNEPAKHDGDNLIPNNELMVKIDDVTAKWILDSTENTLLNVSLDVKQGSLVAVIGPVGAGKTSLLHVVLRELPLRSGKVLVNGSLCYASQEPWLFAASVRQNILFGLPMDKKRYWTVVRACALERDFNLMPFRDKTLVGERGVTLSGGQRARISLARAVYKDADIYLLDDPLSAVDAEVGKSLFENCICNFLQGKTRILVTHQLHFLQAADLILVLSNGTVEAAGSFAQLQLMGLDFTKHLRDDTVIETETNLGNGLIQEVSSCSIQSFEELVPSERAEMRSRGRVHSRVYVGYWSASGSCCIMLLVILLCVLSQTKIEEQRSHLTLGNIQNTSNVNKVSLINSTSNDVNFNLSNDVGKVSEISMKEISIDPNISNGEMKNTVHISTLNVTRSHSSVVNFTLSNFINKITEFSTTESSSNATTTSSEPVAHLLSTNICIIVYAIFLVCTLSLALSSIYCLIARCMHASVNLHDTAMNKVTHATMRFFNTNASGQILNRFSKDMGGVDDVLPRVIIDCMQLALNFTGVIVLVSIVNYWMLIPTTIMTFIFVMLRSLYVGTSRSLKRLDGITRTPIFSHLGTTLHGLSTIRAYKAQSMLKMEFANHQNLNTTACYLFVATSRAFGLWLDLTCVVYIAFVCFGFLFLNDVFGGNVGLAITQAIGLTMSLQWGIRQTAELENQMTSVERILEYTQIDKEPPLYSTLNNKPPEEWPSSGEIIFKNVYLTYADNEPAVLKNISFKIPPGAKVGIVGRTGAGKSSLITAIFRLTELSNGFICIDNINIATKTIRQKFSVCTVLTIAHRLLTVMDSDIIVVVDAGQVVEMDHPYTLLQNQNGRFYEMVHHTGPTMTETLHQLALEVSTLYTQL
ncbi:hypothetical protein C0J52_17331 [Blattella germanica]|nr:hypothetical protein C0J52_17331 [Blattella germanica]